MLRQVPKTEDVSSLGTEMSIQGQAANRNLRQTRHKGNEEGSTDISRDMEMCELPKEGFKP